MTHEPERWSVVVPTCRPDSYSAFLDAWEDLFAEHEVHLIPVFDREDTWAKMPWFIPQRTDMIRSWGFYKAWCVGREFVLTLDDDVRPCGDLFAAYEKQFDSGSVFAPYLSVGALTTSSLQMRGFPYGDREPAEVMVQYGGWHGVLDYDAATQLAENPPDDETFSDVVLPVPKDVPVTTCIMNCAFRVEFTPYMWQLPLLDGKYNRFGDIWSGLLQKKVLDRSGQVMVVNGEASVRHERASDPQANLERETPGVPLNEKLWETLSTADVAAAGRSWGATYRQYTDAFADAAPARYADHFLRARDAWLELFRL